MADDRKINLMPENLRSKESGFLSKDKKPWRPDLVIPENQDLTMTKRSQVSGPSFFSSLANFFKSKKTPKLPKKEEIITKPASSPPLESVKKNSSVAPDVHLPSKIVLHLKQDFLPTPSKAAELPKINLSSKITTPQISGSSFWSKILAFFKSRKSPKTKQPKIELVESQPTKINKEEIKPRGEIKSILAKEIKTNGHAQVVKISSPQVVSKSPVISEPLPKIEVKEMKQNFSLPSAPVVSSPQPIVSTPLPPVQPKLVKETKTETQFHQPQPLIRAKFISEGGGVDLIPQSAKTRSWKQISNLLLMSLFISLLIIGLFYLTLYVQGRNKINQKITKEQQISDLEQQILGYRSLNDEIKNLGEDIKLVYSVLSKHIYWTDFFVKLEKYTVAEVYYKGFSGGNSGALTLEAVGQSYDSVARQLKLLQQPEAAEFVSSASILSAQAGEGGVDFQINIVLNPNLFYYDTQE
jgi:Tfp pilus assembly protein PilN